MKKQIIKNKTNFDTFYWNKKVVDDFLVLSAFTIKKMKLHDVIKLKCEKLGSTCTPIWAILKNGESICLDFYEHIDNNRAPLLQELLMEIDDVLLNCDLNLIKETIELKTDKELDKILIEDKVKTNYTKEELFIKEEKLKYVLKHRKKLDLKSDKIKNSIHLNNKIANALLYFGVYAIDKLEYKNIVSLYCDLESPKFLYAIDSNDKKYYLGR